MERVEISSRIGKKRSRPRAEKRYVCLWKTVGMSTAPETAVFRSGADVEKHAFFRVEKENIVEKRQFNVF